MQYAIQAVCTLQFVPGVHSTLWALGWIAHELICVYTSWCSCWAFTSLTRHGLILGFSQGQWWFTYLCGKRRNNHKHQADHLLCLMFLKPQISSTKYLDLHKGKVFPVCIIQMWVTTCLKLGNILYTFSACFPYVVLYSFIRCQDLLTQLSQNPEYFLLYLWSFRCCIIRCETLLEKRINVFWNIVIFSEYERSFQ